MTHTPGPSHTFRHMDVWDSFNNINSIFQAHDDVKLIFYWMNCPFNVDQQQQQCVCVVMNVNAHSHHIKHTHTHTHTYTHTHHTYRHTHHPHTYTIYDTHIPKKNDWHDYRLRSTFDYFAHINIYITYKQHRRDLNTNF